MTTRIGIDIGGTFTDLVFLDPGGRVLRAKVLSTPDDYSQGIADGLALAMREGLDVPAIAQIMHGTTVATNALLEGKGARVALITTKGFRDVLEIRRLRMPVLYDIRWRKPAPLVPRRLRYEVDERIDARGEVDASARRGRGAPRRSSMRWRRAWTPSPCASSTPTPTARTRCACASSSGSATPNDSGHALERAPARDPRIRAHEHHRGQRLRAAAGQALSRKPRAQARASAACRKPLTIMQSSGGAMSAAAAAERPIHIIESGPAAGVVGAAELARRLGDLSLLTFDMGGTTAKAALVDEGQFLRVNSLEVGGGINVAGRLLSGGGYHVRAPAIDIAEVGAGGGSIARLDAGGALRVGPDSAGAVAGSRVLRAAAARMPTVTDANVILGFINPTALAGGGLADPSRPGRACAAGVRGGTARRIARGRGMGRAPRGECDDGARAARRVRPSADATRAISRCWPSAATGPCTPSTLARLLDIKRILVPPVPGLFSALGMLFPEVEHHYVRTFKQRVDRLDARRARNDVPRARERKARDALGAGRFRRRISRRFERLVDLRYAGANSELTLPFARAGRRCVAARACSTPRTSSNTAIAPTRRRWRP